MAHYFGNDGLILEAAGELVTDRYGLWSGACRYKVPVGRLDLVPALNSAHPHANFCLAERQRVVFSPGHWNVMVDYAGAQADDTEPVFEFNHGTGTEPIETHPNFVSLLGGKPSAPLNGAIFVDRDGEITADDARGVFDRFRPVLAGVLNELAGASGFITATNSIWSKSWTRKTAPSAGSNIVRIDEPAGNAPSFGGAYNWLFLGTSYTKRGGAYACVSRWMLSGRRGWSQKIYGTP
jgi:hypothetical protein